LRAVVCGDTDAHVTLLESLANGPFGLHLRFPASWPVVSADAASAQVVDEDRQAMWWLFMFPGLHLDLSGNDEQGLRDAAHHHARAMFDGVHEQDTGYDGPPRTSDPTWSPLVEHDRFDLQGSPVLRSIHRMSYRPGREIILGHLLVPRPWGLFEARVATNDATTGMRESVQFALMKAKQPGIDSITLMKSATQATYDDPALDASFSQHCLSRSRAALRWLAADSGLRLDAVTLPRASAETTLRELGCTVSPPPRFFPVPEMPGFFRRTSFCGTDGVEQFFVAREGEAPLRPNELAGLAEASSRARHEQSGVEDVALHVEHHTVREGRHDTLVIVEGRGHQGRLRNALYWLLDDAARPWTLSLISSAAIPREQLAAELLAAARSWRLAR
jgi:hypothetical protein